MFTSPNLVETTSFSPAMTFPPPPGSRESVGAVMLNCEKSEAVTLRLSVTKKLANHRQL